VRARKREHQHGTGAKTTKGRNPKLVWFTAVRTRAEAEAYEKHLQELSHKSNARAITDLIIQFEDLVLDLDNPKLKRS
jgi:predicted GIY-YIG superfamily endonuclease